MTRITLSLRYQHLITELLYWLTLFMSRRPRQSQICLVTRGLTRYRHNFKLFLSTTPQSLSAAQRNDLKQVMCESSLRKLRDNNSVSFACKLDFNLSAFVLTYTHVVNVTRQVLMRLSSHSATKQPPVSYNDTYVIII